MSEQLVGISASSLGSGLKSVQWSDAGTRVGTRADDDVYDTAQKRVGGDVSVTLTFQDQEAMQAVALGTEATFTADGDRVSTGVPVTLTVVKFMPISDDGTLNHDTEGTASITGTAASVDGQTSPVSLSV